MYVHEHQIRVRYSETDQMSYVNNGAYASYLEVGRVEALRALGLVYKDLEATGVIMPVLEMNIKYFRPGRYDDLLTVKTIVNQMPSNRMRFDFEITNMEGVLITKAYTNLVFVDSKSGKPIQKPDIIEKALSPYFN